MQLPKHIITTLAMKIVHLVNPGHEVIKPPTMALTVHPAMSVPVEVEKTTAPLPGNK